MSVENPWLISPAGWKRVVGYERYYPGEPVPFVLGSAKCGIREHFEPIEDEL